MYDYDEFSDRKSIQSILKHLLNIMSNLYIKSVDMIEDFIHYRT